ncbi:Sensory neuron membrane protein 2, partial [Operophtera brumata]
LYQARNITSLRGDLVRYLRTEHFEFDAEASFPLTEDDMITIAIIQIAERFYSPLMSVLNLAMSSVFGEHNSPVITVRVRDLLFDGVRLCKDGTPSEEYEAYRGVIDYTSLGDIRQYAGRDHFLYWGNESSSSVCNMINGTDSGIFAPFVTRERSLYAINTDICRSVELRYQYDTEIDGIPTLRYAAKEWFLANKEGCFCLNVTEGINREDGCLLEGAIELIRDETFDFT